MWSRILALMLSSAAGAAFYYGALDRPVAVNTAAPTTATNSSPVATQVARIEPRIPSHRPQPVEASPRLAASPGRPVNRPIEVSERQFDRLVGRGLVLVKFGADWCGPCRRIEPELRQLAEDNAGQLTVLTVDIDKQRRLNQRFSVGSIPNMILFRDGKKIGQWTGFHSASQLQQEVDRAPTASGRSENKSLRNLKRRVSNIVAALHYSFRACILTVTASGSDVSQR